MTSTCLSCRFWASRDRASDEEAECLAALTSGRVRVFPRSARLFTQLDFSCSLYQRLWKASELDDNHAEETPCP